MKIRSAKGNLFERHRHQPSGIIIVWLGNDDKIHTQSIAIQYPLWGRDRSLEMTKLYAKTELLLRQLDLMTIDGIKSMPMITTGLTRIEAKQALQTELKMPIVRSKLWQDQDSHLKLTGTKN